MNKDKSLQELEEEIQKVIDADTNNIVELAKILGYNILTDFTEANLKGIDISSTELIGADFRDVDFSNANLSNTNLSNANLSNANLTNANLTNANLTNANLTNANLTNANLSNANLVNSTLTQANLSYTNLRNANPGTAYNMEDTNFEGSTVNRGYWIKATIVEQLLNFDESYGKSNNEKLGNTKQIIATFKSNKQSSEDSTAELEQFAIYMMNESKEKNDLLLEFYKKNIENNLYSDKEIPLSKYYDKLEDLFNQIQTEDNSNKNKKLEKFKNSLLSEVKENPEVTISELFRKYLNNASSKDEEIRILEYRLEIEEIEKSFKACKEASLWLSQNRYKLIKQVKKLIIENKLNIENSNKVEISSELANRFCESINIYLLWITNFIENGEVPTPLPEGIINLVLPNDYYVKVFEYIKKHEFSSENDLSEQAIIELKGFFERFLINTLK